MTKHINVFEYLLEHHFANVYKYLVNSGMEKTRALEMTEKNISQLASIIKEDSNETEDKKAN